MKKVFKSLAIVAVLGGSSGIRKSGRRSRRPLRICTDEKARGHVGLRAARVDDEGELVLLEDQDRSKWDPRLIALGFSHLDRCAEGPVQTTYHLQAAIAAVHAEPSDPAASWPRILEHYDQLPRLRRRRW